MKLFRTKQNHVLGGLLVELGLVTGEQLDEALGRQAAGDERPLGVILMALGHLTGPEVEHALMVQKARRGNIEPGEGLGLIDRAVECTRKATSCIDDLTLAAQELATKARE